MRKKIYDINPKDLILRDHLAIDRTKLANERNFLAFIRTSLAFVASGFGLIKFVEERAFIIIGWLLIVVGMIILGFGFYRFLAFKKAIETIEEHTDERIIH